MDWQGWFTLGVIALLFVGLVKEWTSTDVLLLAALVAVTLAGVITPGEAFDGFANEAMLTVGALFVVVAAIRETGALTVVGDRLLRGSATPEQALARLAVRGCSCSAFLNNTAVVSMLLPIVTDWCRKSRVSPSRLLIPLSYFSILGGMVTLIGTSTNLVVSGLVVQMAGDYRARADVSPAFLAGLRPFSLLEIAPLGLACAAVGTVFVLLAGRRLLPDRKDLLEEYSEHRREYLVDMVVQPNCRLIGQTIESAGLRQLPGLFLVQLAREIGDLEQVLSPVSPDDVLRSGDRLTFTGVVASIVELERIPGLTPMEEQHAGAVQGPNRRLCEAVISPRSPLIGKTIRDAEFRAHYNAAVVAVHRGSERLQGRVGDIRLHAGDAVLLAAGAHFARAHRNNPDFILVTGVDDSRPLRHDRASTALAILAAMVAAMLLAGRDLGPFTAPPVAVAVFTAATMMILCRCIGPAEARSSIDWETLIAIAASFGLGKALESSGAARAIAEPVAAWAGQLGPVAVLACIYLLTLLFTELITNNAAAALTLPLGLALAESMGVDPRPFAVAVMFAASLAFAVPIGYQTHMMVYSAGGYRFADFLRLGIPLNLLMALLCILLIPLLWGFGP